MSGYFIVSDAEAIALHAILSIASAPGRQVKIRDIARTYHFSEAHLAKVLNRLVKAGILHAIRGPSGGYHLAKAAKDITLHEIYRSIEGDLNGNRCMFRIPACEGRQCPLGTFFDRISREIDDKLKQTHVSDIIPKATRALEYPPV